jgi:putative zinc finger/helix-turn-helix YgiT family protein
MAVKPAIVDYTTEREHDGRSYVLRIPQLEVLACEACQARQLLDASRDRISAALRKEAGLLAPNEIRAARKSLGLTQDELASALKVAKETVSRWETGGQIQQRAMDLLLRIFFAFPNVRAALSGTQATVTGSAGNAATGSAAGIAKVSDTCAV